MNKKILILILITGVIFSVYGRILAQHLGGVENGPVRMPASYTLDDSDKIIPLTKGLETDIINANANFNLELRGKNFSLTDLLSGLKKVFFGIISALGEIKESLFQ